jgi:hypothetical protein
VKLLGTIGVAGLPADVEAILHQLRADLGYPTTGWSERWDVAA